MVADKGKKSKVTGEEETNHIDEELFLSVEKLQELQDELEKVLLFPFSSLYVFAHVCLCFCMHLWFFYLVYCNNSKIIFLSFT
ncbi:hypothetical protein NC653_011386 [Populus alba x Populus x berolinensis]|uniref:Uncharacterized protein n=1 Tax=Populus alba x Populus x berolinensis TaxID=444605 RepID=A0AAD6R228_9ROSI|nr:hypothetical protein NC653_011386 [Populus alba x Populus x berolinensis]